MTRLLLAVVIVLFVVHELVVRRRTDARATWWPRVLILVLLVSAAAAFGGRAQLSDRVEAFLEEWRPGAPPAVSFDLAGDPLKLRALSAQQPSRPFPSGGSADAVQGWQQHIVDRLRQMAELDATADLEPVEIEVVGSDIEGEIRRTLIRFITWDGTRVPAYVHESVEAGGARGAVLVVPGHGDGIQGTAGLMDDYQHGAARELARHGYVTLTPELRGFGLLTPDGVARHRAVASAALEAGSFYKAVVVRDLVAAVSVLQDWEGVDPERVAAAGTSLGGELAVLLAVLDPRIRVIVSQSYGGSAGPTSVSREATDEAQQSPHGCHLIPGINRLIWQEDWFRLLAPRPVLFVRGSRNTPRGAAAFADAVRGSFEAFGAKDRFQFLIEEGDHEFFVEPAARFLAQWL